ncbi:MAG: Nicotinate-nucleotide--dimethylbenzimidazole phosphoribosyltransferase, partial [uncultured Rubrobacteraceae bacterium]
GPGRPGKRACRRGPAHRRGSGGQRAGAASDAHQAAREPREARGVGSAALGDGGGGPAAGARGPGGGDLCWRPRRPRPRRLTLAQRGHRRDGRELLRRG